MNYSEWNEKLFDRFFRDRRGEVTLYVDAETLEELSGLEGDDAVQDFRKAVSSVCPPDLRSHINYAKRRLELLENGQIELPEHLPHLAAFVFAWTVDPENASPQNYIDRLKQVFDLLPGQWYPSNWRDSDELWKGLNRWCSKRSGPRFPSNSIGPMVHIGFSLAHAVLTPSERRRIIQCLKVAGIEDSDLTTDEDLIQSLQFATGFRAITAEALKNPLSLHARLILRRARRLVSEIPMDESNLRPTGRVRLFAVIDAGQILLTTRVWCENGELPESFQISIGVCELRGSRLHPNLSTDLVCTDGQMFVASPDDLSNPVHSNQLSLLAPRKAEVRILPQQEAGGFLETGELQYGRPNLLLVGQTKHRKTIFDWAALQPDFRNLQSLGNWSALKLTPNDLNGAPRIPGFVPGLRIKLLGGIARPGSRRTAFFNFAPPTVECSWKGDDYKLTWKLNGISLPWSNLQGALLELAGMEGRVNVEVEATSAGDQASFAEEAFDERTIEFIHGPKLKMAPSYEPWRDRLGGVLEPNFAEEESKAFGAVAVGTYLPRPPREHETLFAMGARIGQLVGPLDRPKPLLVDWVPIWWIYENNQTRERQFHFSDVDIYVYPDVSAAGACPLPEAEDLWVNLIAAEPSVTDVYADNEVTTREDVTNLFLQFLDKAGDWLDFRDRWRKGK